MLPSPPLIFIYWKNISVRYLLKENIYSNFPVLFKQMSWSYPKPCLIGRGSQEKRTFEISYSQWLWLGVAVFIIGIAPSIRNMQSSAISSFPNQSCKRLSYPTKMELLTQNLKKTAEDVICHQGCHLLGAKPFNPYYWGEGAPHVQSGRSFNGWLLLLLLPWGEGVGK